MLGEFLVVIGALLILGCLLFLWILFIINIFKESIVGGLILIGVSLFTIGALLP